MTMIKKKNRSGDATIDRSNTHYKRTWEEIIDKAFTQTVFSPYPALVYKELVNGYRKSEPYNGGDYDKNKCVKVKDMWNHEHCSICNFKIITRQTYWYNKGRVRLLCDECYDYYSNSLKK